MVSCERDKVGIDKDNVFEVVDDRFAVEEIVCDSKEVPESQSSHNLTRPGSPVETL